MLTSTNSPLGGLPPATPRGPAVQDPPDPSTYHRVLRRPHLAPSQARNTRVALYDVVLHGRVVRHPDGRVAVTLFVPPDREAAADRAARMGWEDVTEAWHAGLAAVAPPPTREALEAMEWTALVALARDRHAARRSGTREQVVEAVLATYAG